MKQLTNFLLSLLVFSVSVAVILLIPGAIWFILGLLGDALHKIAWFAGLSFNVSMTVKIPIAILIAAFYMWRNKTYITS